MVQMLIDLEEETSKKIKEYMIKHNITQKPKAVKEIIEGALE